MTIVTGRDSISSYYENRGPKSRGNPKKYRYITGNRASRALAYAKALDQLRAIYHSESLRR
jgi:hypothetical protein